MSSALAVAGVTAVIQSLLNDVYSSAGLGSVTVSAVAPDIVQTSVGTASNANQQVNLFLHQVTLNTAWRNMELPRLAPDGVTRLSNQPLALDLHYLLTVYGSEDSRAEALLGHGIFFLHENPVLMRNQINAALASLPTTYPVNGLAAAGLANQMELIKIIPATLGREEVAWLWTALKADYRPTFPFQASVVLIEPKQPVVAALPVLTRQIAAIPGMSHLIEADPPNGQPAACLADMVTVQGTNLTGVSKVFLTNQQWNVSEPVTAFVNAGNNSFQFAVPSAATALVAGVYMVSAQITVNTQILPTNSVPLAIAPKLTTVPTPLASGSKVNVAVKCTPNVRPGQQVSLIIGSQSAPADDFAAATDSPTFTFQPLHGSGGSVPVRLRVDGIDSPIIDMTTKPPSFTGPTTTVT
ncbi:MAG TPA: DUF4255 domain-containing protein [Candidatus Angelobacter sp.]|nr:DUF4255 domain-containing protein [Candidatus Angelobacter sp.]